MLSDKDIRVKNSENSSSVNECSQKVKDCSDSLSVIGSLKRHIDFWFSIGANVYILDVISNGYKIPFKDIPSSANLKNNRSALDNDEFVKTAINDLLLSGAISETKDAPFVVNPLTVAQNSTKKRLVLDLRHVNEHVLVDKIKFDDWGLAMQYLDISSYMFSFDFKSGYHHVDIHDDYKKYLGFAWLFDGVKRYFYFNVLPFGLATAGHIFTKTVRCLVKHWRSKGIKILVYIDDGLCIENTFEKALYHSKIVKQDILDSGFVPHEQKSNWIPTQSTTFLGVDVDTSSGVLSITESRINKALNVIRSLIKRPRSTARILAGLAGMLTSMSIVLGFSSSLMARYMHIAIVNRVSWDSYFNLNNEVKVEVVFWQQNLTRLNSRNIVEYTLPQKFIYSDASSEGCGGYIVEDHRQSPRQC